MVLIMPKNPTKISYSILSLLSPFGPLTPSAIAYALDMSPAAVSNILVRLKARGWAEVSRDGRQRNYSITILGQEWLNNRLFKISLNKTSTTENQNVNTSTEGV